MLDFGQKFREDTREVEECRQAILNIQYLGYRLDRCGSRWVCWQAELLSPSEMRTVLNVVDLFVLVSCQPIL